MSLVPKNACWQPATFVSQFSEKLLHADIHKGFVKGFNFANTHTIEMDSSVLALSLFLKIHKQVTSLLINPLLVFDCG